LLELFIIKIVTAAAGTPMNTANYTYLIAVVEEYATYYTSNSASH
jgi:hypothetical protein